MRITGKGEEWTIHCDADELATILVVLKTYTTWPVDAFMKLVKEAGSV